MKTYRTFLIAQAFALAAFLAVPAVHAAVSEEQELQTQQSQIDSTAKGSAPSASKLATQFGVSPDTVTNLRSENRGWGEITIELSMAQQLVKTDPTTYPTMSAALTKIESMRAEHMGWGLIAKNLGFKLGPVISAVERARHDVIESAHSERSFGKTQGNTGKPEGVGRPERPERPERPDHFGGRF